MRFAIALASWFGGLGSAFAQASIEVEAGKPVAVRAFWHCLGRSFEVIPFGQSHGKVWTEGKMARRCEKDNVPQIVVYYQSEPGYKGRDEFYIQASWGDRTQVRVKVK